MSTPPQPLEATRGNPSFVWRSGQARRLAMVNAHAPLRDVVVLDHGTGIGTYVREMLAAGARTVHGFDIEVPRLQEGAAAGVQNLIASVGEALPYADGSFDVIHSNEVLEHVADDRACAREIVRVLRPGGRAVIFVPNRRYFFETHGIYWRGEYKFGNKLGVNWLPTALRDKLAPHVRAYTSAQLRGLFAGTPSHIAHHTRIYGGFDNLARRYGAAGRALRAAWQGLERTPLRVFGLSHMLVVEKLRDAR
jgi:SAM-dependent methyltransferase